MTPNAASVLPIDALAAAHARMDAATVAQLREAVRLSNEGHPIGVFAPVVRQFLLAPDAAGVER